MKKHVLNILKILLVVLVLELTLFNINSYRLFFGDYQKLEYEMSNDDYPSVIKDGVVTKSAVISKEITGINNEVGTIKLNINSDAVVQYQVFYTDETSSEYREMPSKTLIGELENSKSIPCFLAGNTDKLLIKIGITEGTQIELNSIQINAPIQFQFNFVRVAVLSIIAIFVYAIFKMEIFQIPYDRKNIYHLVIIAIIAIIFIDLIIWCCLTSFSATQRPGTYYTEHFVDAIMNGQISLLDEPSEELKQMENPYDQTARDANNVPALWDVAYYNGNYYVYFGILPILTLLIPFKLITGLHMQAEIAVLIYTILSSLFMIGIVKSIFRKWFKDVPFKMMVLTIISVLVGSLLLWLCRRPNMYELVIAAGMCFATLGIFLTLKSTEKEKVNYIYLTFGCLSMALSVACRPTQLFASIVILPILIKIVVDNIKQKKDILKSILSIVLPYGIVGISLMIYNYVRFDSIFEFGTSYQITINDMGNLPYRIMTIPVGFLNYFFAIPQISTQFPFVLPTTEVINFYGYYVTSRMAGGIVILNPVILALLFIPKVKKHISKDLFRLIISLLIAGLAISIVEIVLAGSTQRYAADFAWLIILAAMLVIVAIFNIVKDKTFKKYALIAVLVSVLFSCLMGFLLYAIQGEDNFLVGKCPEQYHAIHYAMSFWE